MPALLAKEFNMETAQEMREYRARMQNLPMPPHEKEVDLVEDKVCEAAKAGKFFMRCNEELSIEATIALEKDGYRVKRDNLPVLGREDWGYRISWEWDAPEGTYAAGTFNRAKGAFESQWGEEDETSVNHHDVGYLIQQNICKGKSVNVPPEWTLADAEWGEYLRALGYSYSCIEGRINEICW